MKLAKEPKEVDFLIKSEPWSEKDTADFRLLIQEIKTKNKRKKTSSRAKTAKQTNTGKSQNRLR
ncbi:MAG TPA: hypothetical protein VF599_01695 [Pyrinomonadaceae bacterium]|jgi:hypothetical protein